MLDIQNSHALFYFLYYCPTFVKPLFFFLFLFDENYREGKTKRENKNTICEYERIFFFF